MTITLATYGLSGVSFLVFSCEVEVVGFAGASNKCPCHKCRSRQRGLGFSGVLRGRVGSGEARTLQACVQESRAKRIAWFSGGLLVSVALRLLVGFRLWGGGRREAGASSFPLSGQVVAKGSGGREAARELRSCFA